MTMYDSTKRGRKRDVFIAAHAHCDITLVLANTRSSVDVYAFGSSIIELLFFISS